MNDLKITTVTGSSATTVGGRGEHRSLPELSVTPDTMGDFHAFSPDEWMRHHVWVHNCTRRLDDPMWLAGQLCAPHEHDLYRMVHHNPEGKDWGTGFLSCNKCLGTAHEPAETQELELDNPATFRPASATSDCAAVATGFSVLSESDWDRLEGVVRGVVRDEIAGGLATRMGR